MPEQPAGRRTDLRCFRSGWSRSSGSQGALAYAPDVDDLPAFIESTVARILEEFPPEP
jgi:hypothetical protein